MRILEGIFSSIGIGIGASARLRALELVLNEGVETVFGAKIGDPGVGAYAGTGDDDHLPRLGERVGDILEAFDVVGLDLERGHLLRGGGRDLDGGRDEPTSARSMWKTSSTGTSGHGVGGHSRHLARRRRRLLGGVGSAWVGSR